jgi:LAO/AO transport system kinase
MSELDPIAIQQGDRRVLSKALTAVENNWPESREIQAALFPHTGQAHLIGVTGASGTGKSTLVNQLAKALRQPEGDNPPPKIAIIAVDPTSPFTGGALLGDRIRMQDLSGDPGIFIRSMASRGALGGLAHHTAAFTTILDGAGFDLILIETVGAGQAEVDIAQLAHTVVVVEAPGLGDDIQAIKAGILEIADILVVNKADRPGAENTARALAAMLEMASRWGSLPPAGKHRMVVPNQSQITEKKETQGWQPPVLQVTATEGLGVNRLVQAIADHRTYLKDSGRWQMKEAHRLQRDLEALIKDRLVQKWRTNLDDGEFERILESVIRREFPPIEAAERLLSKKYHKSNNTAKTENIRRRTAWNGH